MVLNIVRSVLRFIVYIVYIYTDIQINIYTDIYTLYINIDRYTECPRRNVPDFERAFLMLKCTDITQSTYFQS